MGQTDGKTDTRRQMDVHPLRLMPPFCWYGAYYVSRHWQFNPCVYIKLSVRLLFIFACA